LPDHHALQAHPASEAHPSLAAHPLPVRRDWAFVLAWIGTAEEAEVHETQIPEKGMRLGPFDCHHASHETARWVNGPAVCENPLDLAAREDRASDPVSWASRILQSGAVEEASASIGQT